MSDESVDVDLVDNKIKGAISPAYKNKSYFGKKASSKHSAPLGNIKINIKKNQRKAIDLNSLKSRSNI